MSDDQTYTIMKYWHPSSPNATESVTTVESLEEAQEICSSPESSYKLGPTTEWYFLGYVRD